MCGVPFMIKTILLVPQGNTCALQSRLKELPWVSDMVTGSVCPAGTVPSTLQVTQQPSVTAGHLGPSPAPSSLHPLPCTAALPALIFCPPCPFSPGAAVRSPGPISIWQLLSSGSEAALHFCSSPVRVLQKPLSLFLEG